MAKKLLILMFLFWTQSIFIHALPITKSLNQKNNHITVVSEPQNPSYSPLESSSLIKRQAENKEKTTFQKVKGTINKVRKLPRTVVKKIEGEVIKKAKGIGTVHKKFKQWRKTSPFWQSLRLKPHFKGAANLLIHPVRRVEKKS
ncbi:hypothetical protein HMI56_000294 [Coelomomyces lativittatus]|nr:hypothetical protein HMI56_000294 [Coelomomyces lativittatus]